MLAMLGGLTMLGMLVGLDPCPSLAAEAAARAVAPPGDRATEGMVRTLLEETNRERAAHRQGPLTLSPDLSAAAQKHAEDMLARAYFSHESPEGESSAQRVGRIAPRVIVLAVRENILKSEGEEGDAPHVRAVEIIEGWMDSPGHRRNLLADDVSEVGFGVASKTVKGRLIEYSVQVLGRVVGAWSEAPGRALRVPERLRARLRVPVEFFLEDTAHPSRRYKDPGDASFFWLGGVPLVVVGRRDGGAGVAGSGESVVELPRLEPGRYRLLGRLTRTDGYQAIRELRIVG